MPRLDFHCHGDEESNEEHDAARESDDLLGRQFDLVLWEFGNLSFVRQEAHDGRYSTSHHDEQVDKEYNMQAFVTVIDTWPSPISELK